MKKRIRLYTENRASENRIELTIRKDQTLSLKKTENLLNLQSEGADARSGVSVGESESGRLGFLGIGEAAAAADEAVAEDEGVVVLEGSFRGESATESSG